MLGQKKNTDFYCVRVTKPSRFAKRKNVNINDFLFFIFKLKYFPLQVAVSSFSVEILYSMPALDYLALLRYR